MKKYSIGLVIVAVLSAAMLIVVGSAFKPVDSLMRPPKVEGENLSIQLAFESFAGDKYLLKQPIKGSYRSAYTFIDITGDGDEEAVVFYSRTDEIDIVRMNVLDVVDGSWQSVADFQSTHNEIQEIEFADLNGDGMKEIIVGWATYQDAYSKLMSVYEIFDETGTVAIESIFDDSYSRFTVIDVDCDGTKDILNLKHVTNVDTTEYTASFLSYKKGGITEEGFTVLDQSLSSVTAITTDYLKSKNIRRIYIDGYKIDTGLATDCFSWNEKENNFTRYTFDTMSVSALTSRVTNVLCQDINGDGIIEMPLEEVLPGSNVLTMEKAASLGQNLIKWVQIDDIGVTPTEYHLINPVGSYSFRFDSNWLGKITVENDTVNGVLTFCELAYDAYGQPIMGQPCFSIKTISERDRFYSNYDYLCQGKGKYHYCRLYDKADELGITKRILLNSMITG